MRAVCIGRQGAAAIRRTDLEPRKRSSVPSKIRCDKAIVVSRALPMALVNRPMPFSRPLGSSSFLAVNRAATGSVGCNLGRLEPSDPQGSPILFRISGNRGLIAEFSWVL